MRFILTFLALLIPAVASADVTVTPLGTYRLPSFGVEPQWKQPIYPTSFQSLATVESDPSRLWITWAQRAVGQIQLPAANPGTGDARNSPFAKWTLTPVGVGKAFEDRVVASGQKAHWAELRGITEANGELQLNFGVYYDVANANYPNSASIKYDLTGETALRVVPTQPAVMNVGGYLAKVPACWVGGKAVVLRGSYWTNGNDGGPRTSLLDVANPAYPWKFTTSYSLNKTVDPAWSTFDNWNAAVFWELPAEKPFAHGERFVGIVVRKGTAPGWYGNGDKGFVAPNTKDLCQLGGPGRHAYPYQAELWVFKWQQIELVLNGTAATDYPTPCQKVVLPGFGTCGRVAGAVLIGNRLICVQESAHLDSFAPSAVVYVNCLRVFQVGF